MAESSGLEPQTNPTAAPTAFQAVSIPDRFTFQMAEERGLEPQTRLRCPN